MARESHYQSVGNPLQFDRLPQRRSEMALPYQPTSPQADADFARSRLFWLTVVAIGTTLVRVGQLILAPAATGWLIASAIPVAFVCLWAFSSAKRLDMRDGLVVLAGILSTFLFLAFRMPLIAQAFWACCIMGLMTWMIATHWVELCITTPLPAATASHFRNSFRTYLAVAAMLPIATALALQLMPTGFVAVAAFTLGVVQIGSAVSVRPQLSTISIGYRAVVSWFAYDRNDLRPPGTFVSPVGATAVRMVVTGAAVVVVSSLLANVLAGFLMIRVSLDASSTPLNPPVMLLAIGLIGPLSIFATIALPVIFTLPALASADNYHSTEVTAENWASVTNQLRNSVDPVERKSIYQGSVAHDGSPLLVPKSVFREHAHFLGDSGGGKTSLGLAPLIEQLGSSGDCSIVLIDLKADSLELLGTLLATARQAEQQTRRPVPIKQFSNQRRLSTFAFNPLNNPLWHDLDLYTRTDILCGALGLEYGADYGEGYYSSANAAVVYAAIRHYPDTRCFRELAEHVAYVSANAKKMGLHPEIAKAGSHVHSVLDRLGSFDALNVTEASPVDRSVIDGAIDFRSVFEQPQFMYFHLSATLAPGSAPEIARLATYDLLAAATQTERQHQVYLVVDEFQRMVARNLEYMLQLARSMGIGVIIANQAMQDLRKSSMNLIPPIESNCRYRQWFSVSSAEDRERLIKSSGETVDLLVTKSRSSNSNGGTSSSVSFSEQVTPRLTTTDVLLASDHPKQSIVRISRGEGYAQYGGMPFVLETNFHISEQEYEGRKQTPWPDGEPGSFTPIRDTSPATTSSSRSKGPGPVTVTTEVVGEGFGRAAQTFGPNVSRPRLRRRKKGKS